MVKSGYYGDEDLDLVRDRIKVRQINPFITTHLKNSMVITKIGYTFGINLQ